ncbi:hypothetical protein EMIT0P12_90051 [Pseudomonas sp. IT-P12]
MSGNASSPHAFGLFCSGLPGGRLNPSRKKRRPWTSLDDEMVEPGGFEPPSASTPLSVLHA